MESSKTLRPVVMDRQRDTDKGLSVGSAPYLLQHFYRENINMPTLTGAKDVIDKIKDAVDDFTSVTGLRPTEITVSSDILNDYLIYLNVIYYGQAIYYNGIKLDEVSSFAMDTVRCVHNPKASVNIPPAPLYHAYGIPFTTTPSEPTTLDLTWDLPAVNVCECGKEKHGFTTHSTWCMLYSGNGM